MNYNIKSFELINTPCYIYIFATLFQQTNARSEYNSLKLIFLLGKSVICGQCSCRPACAFVQSGLRAIYIIRYSVKLEYIHGRIIVSIVAVA